LFRRPDHVEDGQVRTLMQHPDRRLIRFADPTEGRCEISHITPKFRTPPDGRGLYGTITAEEPMVCTTLRRRKLDSKFQFRAEIDFILGSRRVTAVPARLRRRVTVIEFV